jgi:hypothetical protein
VSRAIEGRLIALACGVGTVGVAVAVVVIGLSPWR